MTKYSKNIPQGYGLSKPLLDAFPSPIRAQRSPANTDVGNYPIGQVWINVNPSSADFNDVWMLTSISTGAANWEPIGVATGGGAPITKYVVDADGSGDYTTIQAAIDAANAAGGNATVWIRNGIYTENLILYSNINLVGATGLGDFGDCVIVGVHTPPTTGTFLVRNCKLESATHIFNSAAAGSSLLVVIDAAIEITNGYVFNLPNWTGTFIYFDIGSLSTNDGVVNNTGGATVFFTDATIGAGAVNPMIISGDTTFFNIHVQCPLTIQGTGTTTINGGSWFDRTITTTATSVVGIANSILSTGATAAISHGSAGALTISNTTITTSNNPAIDGAGAGNINLAGTTFTDGSNLAATLTLIHPAETRMDKLICGDDTYRINEFTTQNNIIQAYATDATATGANYNKAIRGDLTVSSGDGTDSPQAVRGQITHLTGSHHEEGYAGYFWADQNDGSEIDSNLIGLIATAYMQETDAADAPAQWTFGLQGLLAGTDGAAAPGGSSIMSGIASYVTYNTPFNAAGHAYIASRNGGGAGGTAGSAYKVISGGGIADWAYGLDLDTGGAGAAEFYGTADIRFANEATIVSAATGVTLNAIAGDDWFIQLGDNAAANNLTIQDSDSAAQIVMDSDGGITMNGSLDLDVTGSGISIAEGVNATMGTATLVGGTLVVNTTAVTANSRIFLTPQSVLAGVVYVSARVAGTSFTITSTNGADVPDVAWLIIEPS